MAIKHPGEVLIDELKELCDKNTDIRVLDTMRYILDLRKDKGQEWIEAANSLRTIVRNLMESEKSS